MYKLSHTEAPRTLSEGASCFSAAAVRDRALAEKNVDGPREKVDGP